MKKTPRSGSENDNNNMLSIFEARASILRRFNCNMYYLIFLYNHLAFGLIIPCIKLVTVHFNKIYNLPHSNRNSHIIEV